MSSNKPAAATPVASKDKPVKALEEDDEFEDFPAEGLLPHHDASTPRLSRLLPLLLSLQSPAGRRAGLMEKKLGMMKIEADTQTDWEDAETDGKSGKSKNLWEESWDDDDNSDDFASQLR